MIADKARAALSEAITLLGELNLTDYALFVRNGTHTYTSYSSEEFQQELHGAQAIDLTPLNSDHKG